jgi:hypothetical protein
VLTDQVRASAPQPARLSFHLGPDIAVELEAEHAHLTWHQEGRIRTATLTLPANLTWAAHRGEPAPPAGWYSPGFGRKQPAWLLVGSGSAGKQPLETRLEWQW